MRARVALRASRCFVLALPGLVPGLGLVLGPARALRAQQRPDLSLLTVERIFGSRDFAPESFGPARWLDDSTYTVVEPAAVGRGSDLVRVDAATGRKTVLVSAATLTPPRAAEPLDIEDYDWSADRARLLIFTNSA